MTDAPNNKNGWLGGPRFIRVKRWGGGNSNSGPNGKRNKRAFHLLIRLGAEAAMSKGLLFGRPFDRTTKKVAKPDRGKVIWPDPPLGLMKSWWRWKQTGHHALAKPPHIATRHRAELAAMRAHRALKTGTPWRQASALPISG